MAVDLPQPIARYFDADRSADPTAISQLFTEAATVRDEGQDYVGRKAIQGWKVASSTKYTYTAEPIAFSCEAGTTLVTSHLTGDFPGSPVDLRYVFQVDGPHISRLEITS
jgi:hypothetical protein